MRLFFIYVMIGLDDESLNSLNSRRNFEVEQRLKFKLPAPDYLYKKCNKKTNYLVSTDQ